MYFAHFTLNFVVYRYFHTHIFPVIPAILPDRVLTSNSDIEKHLSLKLKLLLQSLGYENEFDRSSGSLRSITGWRNAGATFNPSQIRGHKHSQRVVWMYPAEKSKKNPFQNFGIEDQNNFTLKYKQNSFLSFYISWKRSSDVWIFKKITASSDKLFLSLRVTPFFNSKRALL